MTFHEINSNLQNEEENGFCDFGSELLRGTQNGVTILTIHGHAQNAVNQHENDNEDLEYLKVRFPEGPALGVVFDEEGFEQKHYTENRKKEICSSVVHEVECQTQRSDAEGTVDQPI